MISYQMDSEQLYYQAFLFKYSHRAETHCHVLKTHGQLPKLMIMMTLVLWPPAGICAFPPQAMDERLRSVNRGIIVERPRTFVPFIPVSTPSTHGRRLELLNLHI